MFEERVEVGAAVAPVEGCRGLVVAVLEGEDPAFECGEVGEVGRADGLPIDVSAGNSTVEFAAKAISEDLRYLAKISGIDAL